MRRLEQTTARTSMRRRPGQGSFTRLAAHLAVVLSIAAPAAGGAVLGADATEPVLPAVQRTLSVSDSADFPVSTSKAWKAIRHFDAMQTWNPAIAGTEIVQGKGNSEGTVRVVTTTNGAKSTEKLLAYNDGMMSYKYKTLKSTLPVKDCVSVIEVTQGKTGGSTVTWYSTFKAKEGTDEEEARKAVAALHTAGLDRLKASLK